MRIILIAILTVFATASPALAKEGKGKDMRGGDINATAEQAERRKQEAHDNIGGGKRKDHDRSSDDDSSDHASEDDGSEDDRDRRADGFPGNARAEEMQNRRDERKQIQEEYRADREPGEERAASADETLDEDAAAKKPKKSWWKFWDE